MLKELKFTIAGSGHEEPIIIADIQSMSPEQDVMEDYGLHRYGHDQDRKDDIYGWELHSKATRNVTHIFMKNGQTHEALHPIEEITNAIIHEIPSIHMCHDLQRRFLLKVAYVNHIVKEAKRTDNKDIVPNMVVGFGDKSAHTLLSGDFKTVPRKAALIAFAIRKKLPLDGSLPPPILKKRIHDIQATFRHRGSKGYDA